MQERLLTVLTPTYNRAHTLPELYKSLCNQTCLDFLWLIVDDGSSDNTEALIASFVQDSTFEIKYIKKENGGKHTALNLGFNEVQTYLTFIVDSDDVLTPSAIEEICHRAQIVRDKNLCGVAFLRGYSSEDVIGNSFPESESVDNDINIRINKNVSGDKAEVWRTDILRKYQFPVFDGENFQGENYIWWQIAMEYNMLYVNEIIYITEYLEGGLTRSGRTFRLKNPKGGMENSKIGLDKRMPLKLRLKCAVLYTVYAAVDGKKFSDTVNDSGHGFLIVLARIPGMMLYKKWKSSYLD